MIRLLGSSSLHVNHSPLFNLSTESTQINSLSDVLVAVASLDLKVPNDDGGGGGGGDDDDGGGGGGGDDDDDSSGGGGGNNDGGGGGGDDDDDDDDDEKLMRRKLTSLRYSITEHRLFG